MNTRRDNPPDAPLLEQWPYNTSGSKFTPSRAQTQVVDLTAKRGTRSSAKQLCICDDSHHEVYRSGREPCLKRYLDAGSSPRPCPPSAHEIRDYVLK